MLSPLQPHAGGYSCSHAIQPSNTSIDIPDEQLKIDHKSAALILGEGTITVTFPIKPYIDVAKITRASVALYKESARNEAPVWQGSEKEFLSAMTPAYKIGENKLDLKERVSLFKSCIEHSLTRYQAKTALLLFQSAISFFRISPHTPRALSHISFSNLPFIISFSQTEHHATIKMVKTPPLTIEREVLVSSLSFASARHSPQIACAINQYINEHATEVAELIQHASGGETKRLWFTLPEEAGGFCVSIKAFPLKDSENKEKSPSIDCIVTILHRDSYLGSGRDSAVFTGQSLLCPSREYASIFPSSLWIKNEASSYSNSMVHKDEKEGLTIALLRQSLFHSHFKMSHEKHTIRWLDTLIDPKMAREGIEITAIKYLPVVKLINTLPPYEKEAIAQKLILEIGIALHHLHQKEGFIHRDIKPSNIFFHEQENRFLLGDFGAAASIQGGSSSIFSGTRRYIAPERFLEYISHFSEEKSSSFPAAAQDLWGLGVSAIELIFGTIPFSEDIFQLLHSFDTAYISQGLEKLKNEIEQIQHMLHKKVSNNRLKAILQSLIEYDPHRRMTAEEIVQELSSKK